MITLAEQIAEAQRELALREKCYPQFIKSGRLSMDEGFRWSLLLPPRAPRTIK